MRTKPELKQLLDATVFGAFTAYSNSATAIYTSWQMLAVRKATETAYDIGTADGPVRLVNELVRETNAVMGKESIMTANDERITAMAAERAYCLGCADAQDMARLEQSMEQV